MPKQMPLPQPERHTLTQAAKTTTTVEATAKPRTVQQVLDEQNAILAAPLPPRPKEEILPPVRVMSDEALERHLATMSTSPLLGTMFSFNGQDGVYRIVGDGTEMPIGSEFIGLLELTRHGWIKFNGEGNPPTLIDICISEDTELPPREELGDTDRSRWEPGLDGQPRDPWSEQFVIPFQDRGAGGELYALVTRGVVAINAAKGLLGRWRWHPQRKANFRPIVKIGSGTYVARRFGGGKRPKPVLTITDWVNPDGSTITAPQKRAEFNDDIPY
jgi:hypothetical protein